MKARYYGKEDLTEKLYEHPNAYGSKKLAKKVVTEGCFEEETLEAMMTIKRTKSKCVPEYRRELLKYD